MKDLNLASNLYIIMLATKTRMLLAYEKRDAVSIEKEYHDFRTFTRFLFVRGRYGSYAVRVYINRKMNEFVDMLMESGADWRV